MEPPRPPPAAPPAPRAEAFPGAARPCGWAAAAAVARATGRETLRDPAFPALLAACGLLIACSPALTMFALRRTAKTLLVADMGLATITLAGLLFALFSAANSVSRELESRTALTVLAKPLSRRAFVAGKFAGILLAVSLLFAILAAVLGLTLWTDHVLATRQEGGLARLADFPAGARFLAGLPLFLPQLFFAFLKTVMLTAAATGLALYLPFAANLLACFFLYGAAYLSSWVLARAEAWGALRWLGKAAFWLLPNFDGFNLDSFQGTADAPAGATILWAALYAAAWSGLALLVAAAAFEKKELT